MRFLILLTLSGALVPAAHQVPEHRVVRRSDPSQVVLGDQLVFWGGYGGGSQFFNDGTALDLKQRRWTPLPASPLLGRRAHVAQAVGTKLVIWGGYGSDGTDKSAWKDGAVLDVGEGQWKALPESPLAARAYPASAVSDGWLYIWGGAPLRPTPYADGARYHVPSRQWELLPKSPLSARTSHSSCVVGTRWFICGGAGADGKSRSDGAFYDFETQRWSEVTTSELEPRVDAHCFDWNGRVVVWGGHQSNYYHCDATPDGAVFDPATGQWRGIGAYAEFIPDGPPVLHGDHLWFWGCNGAKNASEGRFISCDLTDGTWTAQPGWPGEPGRNFHNALNWQGHYVAWAGQVSRTELRRDGFIRKLP